MEYFVLRLERGGPWDWTRGMREQDGWDEHARFMTGLVDDGFILLGGPLAGDRETLHVVAAASLTQRTIAEVRVSGGGQQQTEGDEPHGERTTARHGGRPFLSSAYGVS